jgi:hypothetical protein
MTLLDLFERLEATYVGEAIRNSLWLFPVIEAGHLLALALLMGSVLLVDLRLLGLGLRARPVPDVARAAGPWFAGSLVLMFATGIPLFLSEAVKCYFNTSFWVKMAALATAIVFTATVRAAVLRRGAATPALRAAVGLASLGLWFTVAAAGRWIGFS